MIEEPESHIEDQGANDLEDVVGEEGRKGTVKAAPEKQNTGGYLPDNRLCP